MSEKPEIFSFRPGYLTRKVKAPSGEYVNEEIKIVAGYGIVKEIKESEKPAKENKSKAYNIVLLNTYEQREYTTNSGWTTSEEIVELCRNHMESGVPITYYIEGIRKSHISPEMPYSSLKGKDTYLSLAGVSEEETPLDRGDWLKKYSNDDQEWVTGKNSFRANPAQFFKEKMREYLGVDPEIESAPKKTSFREDSPYNTFSRNGVINPGSWAVSLAMKLITSLRESGISDENALKALSKELVRNVSEISTFVKPNSEPSDNIHGIVGNSLLERISKISEKDLKSKESLIKWMRATVIELKKDYLESIKIIEETYSTD